jgi:hypothetical protein
VRGGRLLKDYEGALADLESVIEAARTPAARSCDCHRGFEGDGTFPAAFLEKGKVYVYS